MTKNVNQSKKWLIYSSAVWHRPPIKFGTFLNLTGAIKTLLSLAVWWYEVVMVSAAGGGVSERVWCISDQMDFSRSAGRCPIAQQTVTYLFKLSSDISDVLSGAHNVAAAPWATPCCVGLHSSITYKLHMNTWLETALAFESPVSKTCDVIVLGCYS